MSERKVPMNTQEMKDRLAEVPHPDYVYPDTSVEMDSLHPVSGVFWSEDNGFLELPTIKFPFPQLEVFSSSNTHTHIQILVNDKRLQRSLAANQAQIYAKKNHTTIVIRRGLKVISLFQGAFK